MGGLPSRSYKAGFQLKLKRARVRGVMMAARLATAGQPSWPAASSRTSILTTLPAGKPLKGPKWGAEQARHNLVQGVPALAQQATRPYPAATPRNVLPFLMSSIAVRSF